MAPSVHLRPITKGKGDIYKLILRFQRCQVTRVRSIALEHKFASCGGHKCAPSHILQNWPNLMKYEFVDLRVRLPMTSRSLQSEFYNSRYDHFGGTYRVWIIARLKFASNIPWTVLSPRIKGISPRCTLATCKTLKHQNTKTNQKHQKITKLRV